MIWYMSITCWVIISNSKQVPLLTYIQYEHHAQHIQTIISNQIFLELIHVKY